MKSENLTSSLLIWMPFISFFCLIAEVRTSSTMLNNSGKSRHPCCVPDLRGKALSYSPLRKIFAVGFLCMAIMILSYVSSIPSLKRVFFLNQERMLYLSNAFSASIERIT